MAIGPLPNDEVAVRQTSLLAMGPAVAPDCVGPVDRIDLGAGAWIDHQPNWLPGADQWLDQLRGDLTWQASERPMYDRIVDVPRLTAHFERETEDLPCSLESLTALFDRHYGRHFSRVGCNWYRDGRDSVAWHADRVRRPGDTIVAIVSVGERRPFAIRPAEGGSSQRWTLGDGDLFVLGGTFQALWQHTVPKVATGGERISVMIRG